MGEMVNLSVVLTIMATLGFLLHKLALPEKIVVASLSTTFIAVAIALWKTSPYASSKRMTTCYELQKTFAPSHPPLSLSKGLR